MAVPLIDTDLVDVMAGDDEQLEQRRVWHRIKNWWKDDPATACTQDKDGEGDREKPSLTRRLSRKIGSGLPMVNLPRPATFRRQNSERRDRLTPVECVASKGTSTGRRRAMSARPPSPTPVTLPTTSAPAVCGVEMAVPPPPVPAYHEASTEAIGPHVPPRHASLPPSPPPGLSTSISESSFDAHTDDQIQMELEEKWILNLSMRFRDQSPREKFFVTYAERPSRWRRITVSCDYRDAPPESLERDLQALPYQRDKSARIYEAIRLSLLDIQFYQTVTNLKLQTSLDGRLHVHVTEDVNEAIQYPSVQAVAHLDYRRVSEEQVHFVQHMSGFVYKVSAHGQVYIKKEIPGPDSVAEFLYEINALHALQGSRNVIRFQGLVVDEQDQLVKGLLISYAEQGPLVDMIFDFKHTDHLHWHKRERWSRQIVDGLREIHEAGFVQGDFTLSNIVIDDHDDAKIIDINRRGCPVGWEPPEIARLIESGQRIAMYIGVKSDLYQLGMVLWALAEEEDEPERQPRPLSLEHSSRSIPQYFRDITSRCLSPRPVDRLAASALLEYFPFKPDPSPLPLHRPLPNPSAPSYEEPLPTDTHYVAPPTAVERDVILLPPDLRADSSPRRSPARTIASRHSSLDLPFDGRGSLMVGIHDLPSPHASHMNPTSSTLDDRTTPITDIGSSSMSPQPGLAQSRDPAEQPENEGHADREVRGVPPADGMLHELDLELELEHERESTVRQDYILPQVRNLRVFDTGLATDPRMLHFQHIDSGLADMGDVSDVAAVEGHTALARPPTLGVRGVHQLHEISDKDGPTETSRGPTEPMQAESRPASDTHNNLSVDHAVGTDASPD